MQLTQRGTRNSNSKTKSMFLSESARRPAANYL